jgi:hypothetical protein
VEWEGWEFCKSQNCLGLGLFPKRRGWLGVEESGSLEHFLYDEAYLELICSVWLHLGCLGSNLFAEGNELFWSVSIPHNSSWCWRKILKLRSMAQGFIKFEVDGSLASFWCTA